MEDKGIPRQGMPIEGGGEVTSGTLSPTLGKGIALAYVAAERAETGSAVTVDLRGRPRRARIVTKPFVRGRET
jgi:aminomethyltransferase